MRRLFIVGLLALGGACWFLAHESAEVVKAVSEQHAAALAAIDEG